MHECSSTGYNLVDSRYSAEEAARLLHYGEKRVFGIYPIVKYSSYGGFTMFCSFLADSEPLALVSLFLFYPTLVQMLMQPLNCVKPMGDDVGIVFAHSFDIECYDTSDINFILSLVGICIYVVGIPAFVTLRLYCGHAEHTAMRFLRTWGFFMNGYEMGMQHWECVGLLRKALAVVLLTIHMHEGVRVISILILASGFSLLHIAYKPFDNRFNELLDRMENRHLLIWVFCCLAILYIYLDTNYDDGEVINKELDNDSIYSVATLLTAVHIIYLVVIVRQIWRHGSFEYSEFIVDKERRKIYLGMDPENTVGGALARLKSSNSMNVNTSDAAKQQALPRQGSFTNTAEASIAGLMLKNIKSEREWNQLQACKSMENRWQLIWAHGHSERYMDHKAHIVCDQKNMWFTLLGNHSHNIQARHHPGGHLSDLKLPGGVKQASEKQRRYFLKILMEAFQYIIVEQNIHTFSSSILEFVLRCGATFLATGELRMATERLGTNDTTEQRQSMATKLISDAAREVTTPQEVISNPALSKHGSSQAMGHQSSHLTLRFNENFSEDKINVETHGASLMDDNGHFLAHVLSSAEHILPDKIIRELTLQMFQPDIFHTSLSLEELQANLSMLRTTSGPNLRKWLNAFEEEWVSQRNKRIQDHDADHSKRRVTKVRSAKSDKVEAAGTEMGNPDADDGLSDSDSSFSDESAEEVEPESHLFKDAECQAALLTSDSLANLDMSNIGTSIPGSTSNPVLGNSKANTVEAVTKYEEMWVRFCAEAIHQADVKAARLPAAAALNKHRKAEAIATSQVKELQKKINDVREELHRTRSHVGSKDKGNDELKAEREDLDLTRAAINEAREEIESLKQKLLEQDAALGTGPNMIGKIRGAAAAPGLNMKAAREQAQSSRNSCTTCILGR
jgi:hypothetical protein